jgi:hypothetical protein
MLSYRQRLELPGDIAPAVFPVVVMATTTDEPWHQAVTLGALADFGTRFVIRSEFVALGPKDQVESLIADLLSLAFFRAKYDAAARASDPTMPLGDWLHHMADDLNELAGVAV